MAIENFTSERFEDKSDKTLVLVGFETIDRTF